MSLTEQLLSIDKFEKPKEITDGMAEGILILRLLLLKPGTLKSAPEAGLDIPNRYMFAEEEDLYKLNQEIYEQISTYLPNLSGVEVNAFFNGTKLIIEINTSKYNYQYTKSDNNVLELSALMKAS